jgi:Ca-activated chloride channel family protein
VTAILVTVALLVGIAAVVLVLGSRRNTPSSRSAPSRAAPPPAKRDMRLGGSSSPSSSGSTAMRSTPGPKKTIARRSAFAKAPLWLRVLPILLLIGAVASLGVALTKFRLGKTQHGPIVILAIDTSQSMSNTDVAPSRLAAAEAAARNFVGDVPANFRVGLVVFDAAPTVLVAPTIDRAPVGSALGVLPRGKGTVIGDGLSKALDEIEGEWSTTGQTDAAVILLSDGRDTGSSVTPKDAADRAAQLGVPVYTVVIGGAGKGGADAALLAQLAASTGATVATASTAGQLSGVYEKLGTKLSTDLKISSSAQLYVLLAVLLAVAAAVLVLVSNRSPKY